MSGGIDAFALAFEYSPIVFTGGIAGSIYGGMLPIIAITEAANFIGGILTSGEDIGDFFARFRPLPGGTLQAYDLAEYPFANQTVAANAIISRPLTLPMRMDVPARDGIGFLTRLAIITALKSVMDRHATMGGTYTVATPSFIYTNGILLGMTDISSGDDNQAQTSFQLDFRFPLISLQQATQAQNSLMTKITNGLPTDGSTSGPSGTVGFQNSGAATAAIPSASGLPAAAASNPALGLGYGGGVPGTA